MTIVCRVMILVCLCLAVSVDVMTEAEQEKPSRWKGWESHLKIGSQTYLNELNPDPGSAPLAGFLIGRQLSGRSFVGVSFASAGYEITYLSGTTDEKQVGSFLIVYQFRFRQGHRFRPYLDAGLGVADNRLRHGCEGCLHVRLGGLLRPERKVGPIVGKPRGFLVTG